MAILLIQHIVKMINIIEASSLNFTANINPKQPRLFSKSIPPLIPSPLQYIQLSPSYETFHECDSRRSMKLNTFMNKSNCPLSL